MNIINENNEIWHIVRKIVPGPWEGGGAPITYRRRSEPVHPLFILKNIKKHCYIQNELGLKIDKKVIKERLLP